MNVLMLSPEPPYPLHSGGAYRTASLLHYFARFANVDLLLISESGEPCPLPPGLVRSQQVIPLETHRKDLISRYLRNGRRAAAGLPPLIDRLSGLESKIALATAGKRYDLCLVEHFWCAPYVKILTDICATTVLDLHNVESVLHERCAGVSKGLVKIGHNRFAKVSRALEAGLLPRYSLVLVTSTADAAAVNAIAPQARVSIYPTSFPLPPVGASNTSVPDTVDRRPSPTLVFSANFEYHPNIDAVQFLLREIWPEVRRRHPNLTLNLVGRGDDAIRHLLPDDPARHGIHTTGPIPDTLPEIARASIVLAPLRAGSGTRIKILEAWAASRPVIATALAAEGLDVIGGENIILAADGPAFADAIDTLLASEADRLRIGANGYRTLEHSYSWAAAWAKLDLDPQLMHGFGLKRYTGNF
jgi:glycosyltransferase involved in cell wall biosynthesis